MVFKIMSYNFFSFVMITFFSPLAFAAWTINNPPLPPPDNYQRTCVQWIFHHGFTLHSYPDNREQAINRAYKLDKYASMWAAIYAYTIGGIATPPELLPSTFCANQGAGNMVFPYTQIHEEIATCAEWIVLYGYKAYGNYDNFMYARNQHPIKNYEIALWPDLYAEYLKKWSLTFAVSPLEFCGELGKNVAPETLKLPFISRRDSTITCLGWILIYDFNNVHEDNILRAGTKPKTKFLDYIQFWPKLYHTFVHDMDPMYIINYNMTPQVWCNSMNLGRESQMYPFYHPLESLPEIEDDE